MSLVSRVINIATKPKEEWPIIAEEPATVGSLSSNYILILVAIGPVCSLISSAVFGAAIGAAFGVAPPLWASFMIAIVSYILGLVGVYLTAFIVQKLGPMFQSSDDYVSALKVTVFSYAPYWVAGVLSLIPVLGILSFLVAIYGIYLLYLGLPVVMKTPQDKVIGYLITAIVVSIIISVIMFMIVGAITAAVIGFGAMGAGMLST